MEPINSVTANDVLRTLKGIRCNLNISEIYMAAALNVSKTTYINIENGHSGISLDRLLHIAKILQVEPSTLFDLNNHTNLPIHLVHTELKQA
jgi:transcriptional regulator with XRE-family HTH domain